MTLRFINIHLHRIQRVLKLRNEATASRVDADAKLTALVQTNVNLLVKLEELQNAHLDQQYHQYISTRHAALKRCKTLLEHVRYVADR
jgi:hypothetical protein